MKYFLILSLSLIVPSIVLAQKAPPMGNTKEVIKDVSKAIKKDSKDEKVKKEAKKAEKMAKDDKECPPEEKPKDQPAVTVKSKSPIDGAVEQPKKKAELFFNMQFLVTGKSGEPSFAQSEVPWINYGDEIGSYARKNNMTRDQVLALGDDKIKAILLGSSGLTGPAKQDAVENSMLVAKLTGMKDEAEINSVLGKEMGKASYARKVNFLANFLSYLNDNYDNEATSGGANAGKAVSGIQMMSAINESIRTGKDIPAGVCRHMHQLAVRYAQVMGIKEAFGVGFRTGSGGHRTLVLTSPDDPTKVIQLNYGSKAEMNGVSGPAALSQNHSLPDNGIKIRIFNGKDEHAINLPTEAGGILNRVTGGQDSDLTPDYKSDAQIKQMGIATPYGTVRIFHAETPMGNQTKMAGAAYSIKVKYSDVFYGEYGIAGFNSERPVQGGTMKTSGVYARTTQGFNYKFYSSDKVNLSTFGELHARGTYYCSSVGEGECEKNGDYQVDLMAGFAARYRTGPLSHRSAFIFQLQPEGNDATNGKGIGISMPVLKLSHDTDFKIASDIYGNVGGGVTMYNLGTGTYWTYNGHGGIDSRGTGTYFGVMADGRLTNDTPFWIPGAERTVGGVIKQSIFRDMIYVGVDQRQSLEIKENRYIGLTIGGRF